MDFQVMWKSFVKKLRNKSPEILTGIGIGGMVLAIPLTVIGTIKAYELVEKRKKELSTNKLDKKELVKTTWKCYIPTAISAGTGAGCIIGGLSVNQRRNAALATAYSLSENALKTYQAKVVETIGEKKEQAIRDEIAKDKVQKDPVVNKEVIITGKGETLCYDATSSRYFKCDIEKIRRIESKLNQELYSSMFVSLSDYYYEIGLHSTSVSDDLGWNVNMGPIQFEYSSCLADDDTPCLVVSMRIEPRYDYTKLM